MQSRTIALVVALGMAPSPAAPQSHAAPAVVPASAPVAPKPAPDTPAAPPTPAAPAGGPVKLSEVRGRIDAALAAKGPVVRPARSRRPSPGAPAAEAAVARYEVRWPQDRWQVQWPASRAERLTLTWPQ
jgi:hypothetical protein